MYFAYVYKYKEGKEAFLGWVFWELSEEKNIDDRNWKRGDNHLIS